MHISPIVKAGIPQHAPGIPAAGALIFCLLLPIFTPCRADDPPAAAPTPAEPKQEAPTAAAPAPAPAEPKPEAPPPPPDPAREALSRLLRLPAELEIKADALAAAAPETLMLKFSLATRRFQLTAAGEVLIDSPLSCGRLLHPTPTGQFKLTARDNTSGVTDYGNFLNSEGQILYKGVLGHTDPLPAGASFEPTPPKLALHLDNDGPLIFSGDPTGGATTPGPLILPEKVLQALWEKIGPGTPVVVQ